MLMSPKVICIIWVFGGHQLKIHFKKNAHFHLIPKDILFWLKSPQICLFCHCIYVLNSSTGTYLIFYLIFIIHYQIPLSQRDMCTWRWIRVYSHLKFKEWEVVVCCVRFKFCTHFGTIFVTEYVYVWRYQYAMRYKII